MSAGERAAEMARVLEQSETKRLADMLREEWESVETGCNRQVGAYGSAHVGGLGCVEMHDSGNERGVWVTIPAIRFKSRAEEAKQTIDAIAEIVRNSGL